MPLESLLRSFERAKKPLQFKNSQTYELSHLNHLDFVTIFRTLKTLVAVDVKTGYNSFGRVICLVLSSSVGILNR